MKKLSLFSFVLAFCLLLVGCENSTKLRTAYLTEITSAGSKNYGVRINYAEDSRLEGKGTDVQVKFEKTGKVNIWKEGNDKIEYYVEESDEWYSLTHIFAEEGNEEDVKKRETFEKYEEVIGKTYLFNYDGKMTITLRVVVGDVEENGDKTGEILVGSEPVSEQFKLKIK